MGKLTFTGFIRSQWSILPPLVTADLTGKTVMVIGANTGLGFEASKHFASMNPARLILACRNQAKGEAAIERLQNETKYPSAELWITDLMKFSSVVGFADKFEKDGGRLDILVENAACAPTEYDATPDGWETTLQVNCLSLSLLALRLLPQMIQTSEKYATRPRLVVVTSEVHFWSNIEKSVLEGNEIYKTLGSKEYCTPTIMAGRYNDSKLLNVMFYQELNERLSHFPVIVNGVNPGYCYSELRRKFTGVRAVFDRVMEKALARTTEEGGRQLVYAAVGGAEDEDKMRGAYISSSQVSEASDFAIGPEGKAVQKRLWDEMMGILVKIDPRLREISDKPCWLTRSRKRRKQRASPPRRPHPEPNEGSPLSHSYCYSSAQRYAKNNPSQIHLPAMSENDSRRGDVPADVAERLRKEAGRFRILIIGRANAGKTTILQKVCNTTEDPEIFDSKGNKVDLATVDPSGKRGMHDINNELVFRSNPGFIFQDSRGFESGGVKELEAVKNFITKRAQMDKLREQLHVIWYCLPMDNDRLVTRAEEFFFNECGTGKVILIFTKFDGFVVSTFGKLLNQSNDVEQAHALAQKKAIADFDRLRPGLDVYKHKYPPKGYVCLQDMDKLQATCKDLIEQTSLALDDRTLIQVFVSMQQSTAGLSTKYGIE
ncbi:hypothetical protein D9615_003778 [Tricholomella constricta]|uniref:G domain-containing protein n=1 Tax=Tricholomella constricta TaxID=117010 RepID=A0A8H5HI84_9AGAR|nr:hypothetical protein D9615_003778 [Tricholomella constricta]